MYARQMINPPHTTLKSNLYWLGWATRLMFVQHCSRRRKEYNTRKNPKTRLSACGGNLNARMAANGRRCGRRADNKPTELSKKGSIRWHRRERMDARQPERWRQVSQHATSINRRCNCVPLCQQVRSTRCPPNTFTPSPLLNTSIPHLSPFYPDAARPCRVE